MVQMKNMSIYFRIISLQLKSVGESLLGGDKIAPKQTTLLDIWSGQLAKLSDDTCKLPTLNARFKVQSLLLWLGFCTGIEVEITQSILSPNHEHRPHVEISAKTKRSTAKKNRQIWVFPKIGYPKMDGL